MVQDTLPNRREPEWVSGLRRFFVPTLACLVFWGCTFQRQPGEEGEGDTPALAASEAVEAMLHASAASWNGGDLDGFMDDYWRSGNLSFSGSGGVTRGWEDVRNRYLGSYWAPGAVRDSLRFEDIEVTPLGEEHALALGRYVLYRPADTGPEGSVGQDEGNPEGLADPSGDVITSSGYFSLVLRRLEGQWRIIHDHTSAMEESGEGSGGDG